MDEGADDDSNEDENEQPLLKEQLEFARALIIKQKGEMMALVKKMREMHYELKEFRSKSAFNKVDALEEVVESSRVMFAAEDTSCMVSPSGLVLDQQI